MLTKHSVKLPKSFVAIDLSEKVPDAFDRRANGKSKDKEDVKSDDEGRGRTEGRKDDATPQEILPIANETDNVALTPLQKEVSPAELPPPALGA